MRMVLSILLLCISLHVSSQEVKSVRLEIPADADADSYHLEPIGQNGALIFYASSEVNKEGERNWYFGLFDDLLNQQWLKFVAINDHVEFVQSRVNGKRIHLLFRNTGKSKKDFDFYEIVTYDSKTQAFALISGTIPEKAQIVGFDVIDNTACIALNLHKNASDLVLVSLIDGEVVPVHLFEDDLSSIIQLAIDKEEGQFIVAAKVVINSRYLNDVLRFYTPKGILLRELIVENPESMKMLRDFMFFPKKGGELVVLGTYDLITGRMASLKDLEATEEAKSAGYFFLKFKDDKQTSLHFYDFMTFTNIQGTMQAREIVNARVVNDSTGEKEKHKVLTAYFHLTQPVAMMSGGNYILSTEVYKPQYQVETRMEYDYYGRPYPRTYSVFTGYQYYDVLVASFSEEGKLIWDNEFVIKNVLTYKLRRHSILVPDGPLLTIGYVNEGKLFSKTIQGSTNVSTDSSPVAASFVRDRITKDEDNFIIPWFGQYYLIYGEQSIRNRSLSNQDMRTVFYVNKVAFH